MIDQEFIVDIFKDVVNATSAKLLTKLQSTIDPLITKIHFKYGHYVDIQAQLALEAQNQENRYPLIALFEDFKISHGKEGLTGIPNLKIIILYLTKGNEITREVREASVFRTVLYPIYFEFLKQMKVDGRFNIYDETLIKHDQINRPHWGDPKMYGNGGYLFNDVLDGIELANLQLETFLHTC